MSTAPVLDAPAVDFARLRRERLEKLRAALASNGLDALVLLGQNNVAYATGARAPAADASLAAHRRMVAVVGVDDEWPHLFTAFADGVPAELPRDNVHGPIPVETEAGAGELARRWPRGRVALDEFTVPLHRALRDRDVADASASLSAAKVVKTPDEIELIRAAQRINEAAMADVEPIVRPGARTTELS